jgi:hypothetical protein
VEGLEVSEHSSSRRNTEMNMKDRQSALEKTALNMEDAVISLRPEEVCGLGQLFATLSGMGLIMDPRSSTGAKMFFDLGQKVLKDNNIDPKKHKDTQAILDLVESMKLADIDVKIPVINLTSVVGETLRVEVAFKQIGGSTWSGWQKILSVSRENAKKILGSTPAMNESTYSKLAPKFN